MLRAIVVASIRWRIAVLVSFVVLLALGAYAASRLPIDAVPDISPVQVAVLTNAPGYSAEEVERTVTFPLENALNGIPGLTNIRSVSRADISAITLVFRDGIDPWFARQRVLERTTRAKSTLPPNVGPPELGPLSNGLGEIYQFVLRSDVHSNKQLRTLLDWEVLPRLRSVPGVIEVNAFGGELKEYQVIADPVRLQAQGLTLEELSVALRRASATRSGGYLDRGDEAYALRGLGLFSGATDIENVVLRRNDGQPPVLVRNVADVRVGAALPQGVVTYLGEDEAVTGIVMMLQGSNSREVIGAVQTAMAEIERELPPGVAVEVVYDRADFVERTLHTVAKNLLEGVLIVAISLAVLLGSLRGAVVVVLGIPASISFALFGMHLTQTTGDLMSIGAIDFGFLVDGPIVVLEAVLAAKLASGLSRQRDEDVIVGVMRPVAFSVAIILLVYLPLLGLEGVEGKMFRPMASTMAFALFGALVYAIVFLPAILVTFIPAVAEHESRWQKAVENAYRRRVAHALRWRWAWLTTCSVALAVAGMALAGIGANFVPRIAEGDVVVTIRRAPSINLEKAKALDFEVERALHRFPEVTSTLAMTGRAEVAIDPVGMDNTDVLVRLTPPETWTTASDLDELSSHFKAAVETAAPGTFASVSQPIEDRTNELISGSRADVQIMLYGNDLQELRSTSEAVADAVRGVPGSGDVRIERILGFPQIVVRPDRTKMAIHGVTMDAVLTTIEAARVGVPVGFVYEGPRRFELRLRAAPDETSRAGLGDLIVESFDGRPIPLAEVASVEELEGASKIRRQNRQRTVRVEVNLRGRDLVSWVAEAKQKVAASTRVPHTVEIQWGGQFENFERASRRLVVIVPLALAIVFAMLVAMFQDLRYAVAVFAIIPFGTTGGVFGLLVREMPFSIPAAVGFVALAGVSVLNGVVLANQVRQELGIGKTLTHAVIDGAVHTMWAVITTGAVAALGFLPMALATSAGAEVQRPLATVVMFGIGVSTWVTLFVLPGMLSLLLRAPGRPSVVRSSISRVS